VWSYDFVFDQTEDGRRLKWLPICDEFSRELVALEVERTMEAKHVIQVLDQAVAARGRVPDHVVGEAGADREIGLGNPLLDEPARTDLAAGLLVVGEVNSTAACRSSI
jgi:transposase InsO family protein